MKAIERVLSSEAQPSDRASERTARRKKGEEPSDREVYRLTKLLGDLTIGLRNLRALRPAPWDVEKRAIAQAQKILSVEDKLFKLRQGKLL